MSTEVESDIEKTYEDEEFLKKEEGEETGERKSYQ